MSYRKEVEEEMMGYHHHQKEHNKIVVTTLRQIAKEKGISYSKVKQGFKHGDMGLTMSFWKKVKSDFGDKYTGVDYCEGCQKFSLDEYGKSYLMRSSSKL